MTTRYGGDMTIHRADYIDVVLGKDGNVKEVWFRCLSLPFKQAHFKREGIDNPTNISIEAIEYILK